MTTIKSKLLSIFPGKPEELRERIEEFRENEDFHTHVAFMSAVLDMPGGVLESLLKRSEPDACLFSRLLDGLHVQKRDTETYPGRWEQMKNHLEQTLEGLSEQQNAKLQQIPRYGELTALLSEGKREEKSLVKQARRMMFLPPPQPIKPEQTRQIQQAHSKKPLS